MSEIASWLKGDGKNWFSTDADVMRHERKQGTLVSDIEWQDYTGHSGVLAIFRDQCKAIENAKHWEGFTIMPRDVKAAYMAGKCDRIFGAGDNLNRATPDFLPMMLRLYKDSLKVATALLLRTDCPANIKDSLNDYLINQWIHSAYKWRELPSDTGMYDIIPHKNCTLPLLKRMFKDRNRVEIVEESFEDFALNPNCTPEFMLQMYNTLTNEEKIDSLVAGIHRRGFEIKHTIDKIARVKRK